MKDQWIKWSPNIPVQRKYYITRIDDNVDGMYVYFVSTEDHSKIRMYFPGIVYAYRTALELSALETLDHVVAEDGHWMGAEWTFFLVENSSYIDEMINNSKGIYADYDLKHFAVVSGESILEVITEVLPTFIEGWEDTGTV